MSERMFVPWDALKYDIFLALLPVIIIGSSLGTDIARNAHNFFQRSGALVVIVAVYLGARGLNKYWVKADKSIKRGYWAQVSRNQEILDITAIFWSVTGTFIWGYGDMLYCMCIPNA